MGANASQITSVSIVCHTSVWAQIKDPPVTGDFPSQRASNAENVSIWWRDVIMKCTVFVSDVYTSWLKADIGATIKGRVVSRWSNKNKSLCYGYQT